MFRLATQPNGRRQLWLLLSLSALFVLLLSAAVPAPAQGIVIGDEETPAATDGDYPTDAEVGESLAPRIISEVRRGDKTTITIEIPTGSDTFTSSGAPNTNWANDPNTRVGFNTLNGLGAMRTYLFFDVSSIPSNATVQTANLRLWINSFSPTGDQAMGILARFLNTSWNPNTITWNNYVPSWGAEIGIGNVPAQTGWVQGNIANAVQQWVNGSRQNFGIMLQGDETPQQRERVFTTLNANNGLAPRLVVTYDVNVDTTPPVASVNALPQFSRADFTVTWSGTDNQSGIRHYDVQIRQNGGAWQIWRAQVTTTTTNFTGGQNGVLYEFRARAVDNAGNVQAWSNNAQAGTTVDTQPPTANLNPLPQFSPRDFTVSWSGTDNLSGLKHYDVQYRQNGGNWQNWRNAITATSAQFTNASEGAFYEFRIRAVDNLENISPWSGPQASTTIQGGPPTAQIIPFSTSIVNGLTFTVRWQGTAGVGSNIVSFDVRYQLDNGTPILWQNSIGATSAQFTAPGDGIYRFQVRARDDQGRVGEWSNNPGSTIVVDTTAPFITPRMFVPVVPNP
jgi:hypothetical protein